MNQTHKDILRTKRTRIIEEIHDIKRIAYALEENGIITNFMLEEIMAKSTATDKKRELLTTLPRRGENAFDKFYEVLVSCDECSAADILKPELAAKRKANKIQQQNTVQQPEAQSVHSQLIEENDDLPEKWPDESLIDPEASVIKCDVSGPMYDRFQMSQGQSSRNYKNQSVPRGKAVIINNYNFKAARDNNIKLEDRDGTDIDQYSMDKLFGQLYYEVEIFEDLSRKKLLDTIQAIAQKDHSAYDSFVFVILTHGEKDNIYGVDGECLPISSIISSFNGSNCPTLVGKPKLFFFQACQGDSKDSGVPLQAAPQLSGRPDNYELSLKKMKQMKMPSSDETRSDCKKEDTVPSEGDIFIASATIPDYLSWRNTRKGTWFIQAVVYVFQNFAYKNNLNDLMTKVNGLVNRGSTDEGYRQVSTFQSRFHKSFYFFPGLPPLSGQIHCHPTN